MSDFDKLLENYTTKGNAKVHGVLAKCVDKEGVPRRSKLTVTVLTINAQATSSTARSLDMILCCQMQRL